MTIQKTFRNLYAPSAARVEILVNAAAFAACAWACSFLWSHARAAYDLHGAPPTTVEGLLAAAQAPDALVFARDWGISFAAALVLVPVAWTALEGACWLLKRFARPF